MKKVGVKAELVDGLDPAQPLALQGIDSIDYPLTIIAVEYTFSIKIPEQELLGVVSLNDFAAVVAREATRKAAS